MISILSSLNSIHLVHFFGSISMPKKIIFALIVSLKIQRLLKTLRQCEISSFINLISIYRTDRNSSELSVDCSEIFLGTHIPPLYAFISLCSRKKYRHPHCIDIDTHFIYIQVF